MNNSLEDLRVLRKKYIFKCLNIVNNFENKHMTSNIFPDLVKLPTSEKLLLLEQLWDSIRTEPADFSVPDTHKKELDKRLETLNPASLLSLNELKNQVDTLIQNRKEG